MACLVGAGSVNLASVVNADNDISGSVDVSGSPVISAGSEPSAEDRFDPEYYNIDYILKNYNYFVKGDVATLTHTVGAVVIGGTEKSNGNNYGLENPVGVPSYIGSADGNFYPNGNNHEIVTYYGDADCPQGSGYGSYTNFIDFDEAFSKLSSQSTVLANAAERTITSDDVVGGAITVNAGERVLITAEAMATLGPWGRINIVDSDGVGLESSDKGTVISIESSGEVTLPSVNTGIASQDYYEAGLSLVWNLPNATQVLQAAVLYYLPVWQQTQA